MAIRVGGCAFALIMGAALSGWSWSVPAQAAEGAVAGTVLAERAVCFLLDGAQKRALKPGDPVAVGDTVSVPLGAKIKLQMIDGSVIAAGSGSTLTIQGYDVDKTSGQRDAVMALAGGLLRSVVAKATQPSTFEVTTATGVAAVRSTDWFVEATPTNTRVGVLKGVVILTSGATKRAMRIPARWGSHVLAGKDPVPARKWTAAEFADVIRRTDLN
jgi:hypothetical protein